ncbi:MAG: hypothetical protein R3E58_07460 [Phycisphaerae bacterium]
MGMKHVGINLFVFVLTATALLPIARADSTSPDVDTPIELGRIPWVESSPSWLLQSFGQAGHAANR